MIEGQWDNAIAHIRKAVATAPLSADAATLASFILACAGQLLGIHAAHRKGHPTQSALSGQLSRASRQRLSPHGPLRGGHCGFQGFDARSAGFGLTDLVIAYQQTNRPERARQTAERFLALRPTFTVAGWLKTQFRRDRALLDAEAAALAAAGLPPG